MILLSSSLFTPRNCTQDLDVLAWLFCFQGYYSEEGSWVLHCQGLTPHFVGFKPKLSKYKYFCELTLLVFVPHDFIAVVICADFLTCGFFSPSFVLLSFPTLPAWGADLSKTGAGNCEQVDRDLSSCGPVCAILPDGSGTKPEDQKRKQKLLLSWTGFHSQIEVEKIST